MSHERMTADRWQMARQFMLTQARPLERALYTYYFDSGAIGQVLAELETFQNPDGGFGRALEPDTRVEDSSAIATTVALQVLRELGVTARDEMVGSAIRYLLNTYDSSLQAWLFLPPSARAAPHAPWWHFDEYPPQRWENCLGNPRPAILGYLYDYQELVPADLLEELASYVLGYLKGQTDTMEMHDFLCYVRLAETRRLPASIRTPVITQLREIAPKIVVTNEAAWSKYGLTPLAVAPSPVSALADLFRDAIQQNLDYELRRQQEDGGWLTTWSWGDKFPDAAQVALCDGRSFVTLRTLKALSDFGRLP